MKDLIINNFLQASLIFYMMSAVVSIFPDRFQKLTHFTTTVLTSLASLLGFIFSIFILFNDNPVNYSFDNFFNTFEIYFSVNRLNSIFLAILFFVTFTSVLFGFNYVKHFFGKYRIGFLSCSLNIFVVSMIAVLMAQTIFTFIFFWELMSISSFLVIIFESDKSKIIRAGLQYIVFTQFGVLFIIAAFLLLSQSTGSQVFANFIYANDTIKLISTILLILGFGTKAGLIPLHIWLPEAHPAAPSHVSAIISGVMLKVAVFAMIEFFVSYIRLNTPWIGVALIVIGAITAVLGSMYSFVMNDIKKLMAYSSIDNIGIITMLLGTSLLFLDLAQNAYLQNSIVQGQILFSLFITVFLAMIFHSINHAVYKSALFQSTGIISTVYETKDLNKLGGIARSLPLFTLIFIILSMSISAIPPLNGFASEWLSLQTMIGGLLNIGNTDIFPKLIVLSGAMAIILTGAFTAATFVKTIGIGFLGVNREGKENVEQESKHFGISTYISLGISVITVIILGIFSNKVIEILSLQLFPSRIDGEAYLQLTNTTSTTAPATGGSLSTMLIFLIMIIVIVLVIAIMGIWKTRVRKYITWDCGRDVNARMQYSAIAFSDNLRSTFPDVYYSSKSRESENVEGYKYNLYLPTRIIYKETYIKVYNRYIYTPLQKLILFIGDKARKLQTGLISTYLIYILITLVIILLIVTNV